MKFMLRLDEPTGDVTDAVNTDEFGSGSTNSLVSTAGGLWWAGGLRVHISVQGAQRGSVPGTQAHPHRTIDGHRHHQYFAYSFINLIRTAREDA